MAPKVQPQDLISLGTNLYLKSMVLSLTHSTNFLPSCMIQSGKNEDERKLIAHATQLIRQDPILMERFCDRLYQLLQADLQQKKEHSIGFGRQI